VRVLVIDGERVLLVRHRGGRRPWSLPGGGVERRERMIDAARRECLEETGSAVRIERLMGMYDSFFLGVSNYIAVFVATPLNKPKPPLSVEIAEARFFSMNSLPENTEAGCLRRIAEYRAGRGGLTDMW
jgi:ADP-ribose pyrophosphatase YjhB (NUDIX family)